MVNFSPVTLNGSVINSLLRRRLNMQKGLWVCDKGHRQPSKATPLARLGRAIERKHEEKEEEKERGCTPHSLIIRSGVRARGAKGEHAGRAAGRALGVDAGGGSNCQRREQSKDEETTRGTQPTQREKQRQ